MDVGYTAALMLLRSNLYCPSICYTGTWTLSACKYQGIEAEMFCNARMDSSRLLISRLPFLKASLEAQIHACSGALHLTKVSS